MLDDICLDVLTKIILLCTIEELLNLSMTCKYFSMLPNIVWWEIARRDWYIPTYTSSINYKSYLLNPTQRIYELFDTDDSSLIPQISTDFVCIHFTDDITFNLVKPFKYVHIYFYSDELRCYASTISNPTSFHQVNREYHLIPPFYRKEIGLYDICILIVKYHATKWNIIHPYMFDSEQYFSQIKYKRNTKI